MGDTRDRDMGEEIVHCGKQEEAGFREFFLYRLHCVANMPNPSPAILMPTRSILKHPKVETDHLDPHNNPTSESHPSSPPATPASPTHPDEPHHKKEWWLPFNIPFHNGIFRKNAGL
ncbi:hypothetical protein B9Z55_011995 [Caenorhabditis nigoni]|nr:hypothetical protein B9Z55_011995 [Caenorhabditis nigoni]